MLLPSYLQGRRHIIWHRDRVLVVFNADGPFPTTSDINSQSPLRCRPVCIPTVASNTRPYLCTMPAFPSYAGAVLGGLAEAKGRLPIVRDGTYFRLDPTTATRWDAIEKILKDLALALMCNVDPPYIPLDYTFPPSPRRSGFLNVFPSKAAARNAVRLAKDAFLPLIAHVAWAAIAHRYLFRARNPDAKIDELDNGWMELLCRKYDVEPAWVEDLKISSACDFNMLRAGVIVENPSEWAFSDRIPALIEANIPVWLVWNSIGGSISKQLWPSDLRPLEPTMKEIQSAQEAANLAQGLQQQTAYFIDSDDDDQSGRTEEQISDFHQWMKRKQDIISAAFARGTEEQRHRWSQTMLSAEKMPCPGKKRATVYEWSRNEGGGYNRERVSRARAEDVWRSYGEKQRWYNYIADEWELCVELDPAGRPIDAGCESSDDDGLNIQHLIPCTVEEGSAGDSGDETKVTIWHDSGGDAVLAMDDSTVDLTQIGASVPTFPDITDEGGLGYDAFNLMCIRFGFSFTPGSAYPSSEKKPLKLEKALKVIGDSHRAPIHKVPTGIEASFIQYVMLLVDVGQDSTFPITSCDALCDMLDGNQGFLANVKSSIRVKRASYGEEPLYLLQHLHDSDRDWQLAVKDPCTALQALRSNPTSMSELVSDLVEGRTPFFTLRELREAHDGQRQNMLSRTRTHTFWKSTRLGLGIRPPGHVLGLSDFKGYEITRNRLLENKRVARAAIKRGGVLSRLAAATVDDCIVLDGPGPVGVASEDRVTMNITIDGQLHVMYDDNITEQEQATLVGLYNIYGKCFVPPCIMLIS